MLHDPTVYETIEAVGLDFKANTINFFEKEEDVVDNAPCAQWGIWGGIFIKELHEIDDRFWLPYNQIKPLIAYINLQLYTTRIQPENAQSDRSKANVRILEDELKMALVSGSDLDPHLTSSIDQQIAAVSGTTINTMIARQNTNDELAEDYCGVAQNVPELVDVYLVEYRPQKPFKYLF
jgi:hypothetical protein